MVDKRHEGVEVLLMKLDVLGLFGACSYLKSSIAYMLYGWVIEWMKRGMQESGTEIALMIKEAQKFQH